MKKVFYLIGTCCLALLAVACNNKNDGAPTKPVITTVIKNVDRTRIMEAPEQVMELEVVIQVQSGTVTEALTPVLKVDESAVAAYNAAHPDAEAVILPTTAYKLEERAFAIARGGKESATDLTLVNAGMDENKLYVLPVAIDKLEGSSNWELAAESTSFVTVKYIKTDQNGSAENPYLLSTVDNLEAMSGKMKDGEKIYFKMLNDIDMAEVTDWIPLNYGGEYLKGIDFNGNGCTISNFFCEYQSYPSFFGVLNGACYDVTFVNASILQETKDSGCGIIGGYAGTGEIHADITNVHVQGKVDFRKNKTGIGGLVGCAGNATIKRCSADVDVYSSKNYVGALVGYSKKVEISDCWAAGSVRGDQRVGGLVGGLLGQDDSIQNCYFTGKLYATIEGGEKDYAASRSVGGIVGHANLDNKGGTADVATPNNLVSGCIAWMDELKTRTQHSALLPDGKGYYSSGAIVAFGASHNTYKDCYRKADLDFLDYADVIELYDQENSSPENELKYTTFTEKYEEEDKPWLYNFPYHGKAAAAGATLTQVAQTIGWSADIWDFSGDVPVLK